MKKNKIINFLKRDSSSSAIVNDIMLGELIQGGYSRLDNCPEIIAGVRRIADLISSMTIYLMANTEKGDKRIINELSRKVDIKPYKYATRKTWMDIIVMNMLLYGKGNSVVIPHTSKGLLEDLEPIRASRVQFEALPSGGYNIVLDGATKLNPDSVLHFVFNPDKEYLWKGQGLKVALRDVADNLRQAQATTKAFMASKWKPSVVVKVDGITDEFANKAGRKKLLESYIESTDAGEPWMIPAEQFDIQQIKPLSLNDLAVSDTVTLDKKTVAAILGVPAFVLGVGTYSAAEWNNFINTTIRPIAREIEQELTRKLLISDKMYFMFNIASIYSYDLEKTASVYENLFVRGIVTGNEVRSKIGMEPKDGLDQLTILENYIPLDKIADQQKLKGDE